MYTPTEEFIIWFEICVVELRTHNGDFSKALCLYNTVVQLKVVKNSILKFT